MISGADDRIAFVIDTEAKLDGIKAARAQVAGLGADTKLMGVSSAAATKTMSAWDALQAEAAGHVGEHSLAIGRLERNLAGVAERALGVNSTVGLLSSSLLKFSIGSIETVGILAGIAAISALYDAVTESARKATDEQNKLIEALEKTQREKAQGPQGAVLSALGEQIDAARAALANPFSQGSVETQKANLARLNKDLEDALAERSVILHKNAESIESAYVGNIATLVSYNAQDTRARNLALSEIRRYQGELAKLGEGEITKRAEIIGKIKTLNATFEEEDKKAVANEAAAMRRTLTRAGQAGDRGSSLVIAALDAQEKAQLKVAEAEKRGDALHADMQAKATELTLQSIGKETDAKLAANEAEYMRRNQDIANLADTEAQKTQLYIDSESLRQAGAAAIRRAALDKEERERLAAEDKLRAAEKRKEKIMLNTIDAFVRSSGSLQHELIALALNPIIKELEGTAVRQFVRAAAAWPNVPAMLHHAAAGALAVAGAREVAQLGGLSSGGGSGGGSSGGGGDTGTFEPRSGTEGAGAVTIQLYSMNPYGAEQVQELQYQLKRAGILKVPIPISPTKQLRSV